MIIIIFLVSFPLCLFIWFRFVVFVVIPRWLFTCKCNDYELSVLYWWSNIRLPGSGVLVIETWFIGNASGVVDPSQSLSWKLLGNRVATYQSGVIWRWSWERFGFGSVPGRFQTELESQELRVYCVRSLMVNRESARIPEKGAQGSLENPLEESWKCINEISWLAVLRIPLMRCKYSFWKNPELLNIPSRVLNADWWKKMLEILDSPDPRESERIWQQRPRNGFKRKKERKKEKETVKEK